MEIQVGISQWFSMFVKIYTISYNRTLKHIFIYLIPPLLPSPLPCLHHRHLQLVNQEQGN